MITASLVYLALKAMIVRPIQRLTTNMVAFSEAPEDASRVIRPTQRTDEIGVAEEQLAAMQNALRETLQLGKYSMTSCRVQAHNREQRYQKDHLH